MKNDRIKQVFVLLSNQLWQWYFEHIQCIQHFTSNVETFKCNRSETDLWCWWEGGDQLVKVSKVSQCNSLAHFGTVYPLSLAVLRWWARAYLASLHCQEISHDLCHGQTSLPRQSLSVCLKSHTRERWTNHPGEWMEVNERRVNTKIWDLYLCSFMA